MVRRAACFEGQFGLVFSVLDFWGEDGDTLGPPGIEGIAGGPFSCHFWELLILGQRPTSFCSFQNRIFSCTLLGCQELTAELWACFPYLFC
jgi:hypothetical protein